MREIIRKRNVQSDKYCLEFIDGQSRTFIDFHISFLNYFFFKDLLLYFSVELSQFYNLSSILLVLILEKIMSSCLLSLVFMFSWFWNAFTVSVHINLTSEFTFINKIIKAEVTNIYGEEFSFILFDNGTISKLDAHLNYIDSIQMPVPKKIIDFSICNTNYFTSICNTNYFTSPSNTPSIFILLDGLGEWQITSLIDKSISHTFTIILGAKLAVCQGIYFDVTGQIVMRVVAYSNQILIDFQWRKETLNLHHLRSFNTYYESGTSNRIKEVIPVTFEGENYMIIVTQRSAISLYSIKAKQFVYYYDPGYFSEVSQTFHDKQSIVIVRDTQKKLLAKNLISNTQATFSTSVIMQMRGLYLKAVRPRHDKNGQRVFIYHSKSLRLNLNTTNDWSFVSEVQTGLPFNPDSKIGFNVFNTPGSSFLYIFNDSKIYAYCESLLAGKCQNGVVLPCALKFPFCESCDHNYTICNKCKDPLQLVNSVCIQIITSCSVVNCKLCFLNETCLSCTDTFRLDETTKECVFDVNQNHSKHQNEKNHNSTFQDYNPIDKVVKSDYSFQFNQQFINSRRQSYNTPTKSLIVLSTHLNETPMKRVILGFLSPLFGLFDDFSYYIYHINNWKPFVLFPDILIIMHLVNQVRILPDYLRFSDSLNIPAFKPSSYFQNYTQKRIMQIDNQATYKVQNFEQIILQQFPIFIVLIILIKFMTKLMKRFLFKSKSSQTTNKMTATIENANINGQRNEKSSFLQQVYEYLMDLISYRKLLITFFGTNLIYVAFKLSSQLRLYFVFKFEHSVNLSLAALFGFVFIFLFLILITLSSVVGSSIKIHEKDSKQLANLKMKQALRQKYDDMHVLVFSGIKCVLYGFIHAYFMDQNELQYILLIIVKAGLLLVHIRCSYLFENRFVCVMSFIYYFSGLMIDTVILLEKLGKIPNNSDHEVFNGYSTTNLIQFTLVTALFASVILSVFFQLVKDLRAYLCPQTTKVSTDNKILNTNFLSLAKNIGHISTKASKLAQAKIIVKQNCCKEKKTQINQSHKKNVLNGSAYKKGNQLFGRNYKILKFDKDLIRSKFNDRQQSSNEQLAFSNHKDEKVSMFSIRSKGKFYSWIDRQHRDRIKNDPNQGLNSRMAKKMQKIKYQRKELKGFGMKVNFKPTQKSQEHQQGPAKQTKNEY